METVWKVFDKTLDVLLEAICLAMCLVVLWQVITRFFLHVPSAWSEEIARYFLVWMTFLGSAVGLREGAHMNITFLLNKMSRQVQVSLRIFGHLVCFSVGYIFVFYGYQYMVSGLGRSMLSLPVSMMYVYIVVPLSGLIIIINCLRMIYDEIRPNNTEMSEDMG